MASGQPRQGVQDTLASDGLADLNETFERLRRRHTRLTRLVRRREAEAEDLTRRSRGRVSNAGARDRVCYHRAWSSWSQSYDELAATADRLLHTRPRSLPDLLMIFSALEWLLLGDEVIVDQAAERQVRRFGRNLRRLAAGE